MGQAIITSGGPNGLYNVTLRKHGGNSAARLAAISARLSVLGVSGSSGLIPTAEAAVVLALNAITIAQTALNNIVSSFISGAATRDEVTAATKTLIEKQTIMTQKQRDLSVLNYEKSSIEKEQTRLTLAMTTEPRTGTWCTDLTEDLVAGTTVGTMEMNGVDDQIIISPGGDVAKSIGLLQHPGVSTGAAVFLNKARLPGWQKWKPTYRVGTITAIDYETDKCDVGIEAQFSEEQGLQINQTGTAYTVTKAAVQGFADFAALNPDFALVTNTDDTTITNTEQLQVDLARINSDVNDRYKYKTDTELYAKLENWTIMSEGGSGDCEDFALTKAKKLLDLGYPASAMNIEVGTAPNGQGHAWLVVKTNKGEFALDNNYKTIMANGATPYTARSRQTGLNWSVSGVKLSSVPIEYMDGENSDAFIISDRVVVQFVGQDWTAPKVVGFETNPRVGRILHIRQKNPVDVWRYNLAGTPIEESGVSAGEQSHYTGFYYEWPTVPMDVYGPPPLYGNFGTNRAVVASMVWSPGYPYLPMEPVPDNHMTIRVEVMNSRTGVKTHDLRVDVWDSVIGDYWQTAFLPDVVAKKDVTLAVIGYPLKHSENQILLQIDTVTREWIGAGPYLYRTGAIYATCAVDISSGSISMLQGGYMWYASTWPPDPDEFPGVPATQKVGSTIYALQNRYNYTGGGGQGGIIQQ